MTEREFTAFIERNAASFENFARVMARRNDSLAFDDLLDARSGALLSVWLKFRKEPMSQEIEAHMKHYTLRCIKTNALKRYRDTHNETRYDSSTIETEDTSPSYTGASIEDRLDDELAKLPPKIEAAVRVCCLANPPHTPAMAAEILETSVAEMYRRRDSGRNYLENVFGDLGYGFIG